MSLYYPTAQPTIAPSIMVRRERRLPVPGDILVRLGARVEPDDVVAQANLPGARQTVDVAGALAVPPATGARYLSKEPGAQLAAGDVVASRRLGLARRVTVKSPVAGTLAGYDPSTGWAAITPSPSMFELQAFLDGVVTEHIPYRGVVIDTPAALVRGIMGLGGEKHGVLQVAVSDSSEELLPELVAPRLAYSIVLGGGTTSAAALRRAVENNVRAVIVGSIPEAELRDFLGYPDGLHGWALGRSGWDFPPPQVSAGPATPAPLTLVVVEGFGRAPMTQEAWELLAAFDGQEALVDGTTRLRNGLRRPEIVLPLSRATGVAPFETTAPPLAVRALVRLVVPPYLGHTGHVLALSTGKQPIASGLSANAAEIQWRDGTTVWVPLANLEVIE